MLEKLIQTKVLQNFFKIELTGFEREMANEAITRKYAPAIRQSILYTSLLTPSLLVLDTAIVISVLIPTTMVAGTAWFSVSLASMKKKFEDFGVELTKHLFNAFTLSLLMLMLSTTISLLSVVWKPYTPALFNTVELQILSAFLACTVVAKLLYSIFAGSLKYDINDAMLTGQNEAAERFFKQSLSLLYTTAGHLRQGMPLSVANYYLGLCFYEVFNNIRELALFPEDSIIKPLSLANRILQDPSIKQRDADSIVILLIKSFLSACSENNEITNHRSYRAINFELMCLENNREEQSLTDIRMSIVLSEISNLIEDFGPNLFDKNSDFGQISSIELELK